MMRTKHDHPWRNTRCPSKKLAFASEASAYLFMSTSRTDAKRAYLCPMCDMWHMTKSKARNGNT